MLIAGDVGGTKTDLAIYTLEQGPRRPIVQQRFHSADYASLTALVREFLAGKDLAVEVGAFAVPGPVVGGHAKTTNLPWVLDEASVAQGLNLKSVHLLNDLEAVARAVPHLEGDDLSTLTPGQKVENGALAVVAPGTGLGEAFLIWGPNGYTAHGSEGGHADFAPRDERQIRLLAYLLPRFGHVAVERVCSGIGVPNLYEFLRDVDKVPEDPEVSAAIAGAPDRTKAIIDAGKDAVHPSQRCRAVLDLLTTILAAEAGNLVLKVMATGGVYFAGGIAFHLRDELKQPRFAQTFSNKGRFKDLMERIPVHVITARAALLGAALAGISPRESA
jgi:glucokinase